MNRSASVIVWRWSLISDLNKLCKARLSSLILMTTLVGFLLGWHGPINYILLGLTLVGTTLSAAGASALNQWMERDFDALMERTLTRPLPSHTIHPSDALMFGLLCSGSGIAILGFYVNLPTAFIATATVGIYALIYTPMKRISELNTLIGAIPGALPPVLGWTAATGHLGLRAWILFLILWFWQMPHFLAIAWLYKDQYAVAGFKMLSTRDTECFTTSWQSLIYSIALFAITIIEGIVALSSFGYFLFTSIFGISMIYLATDFVRTRSMNAARMLFFASILYLPLQLGILVFYER